MSDSRSLREFVRRWWNWWRLPRFKSDDEMADWFETHGDVDLPVAAVTVADDLLVVPKWTPEGRRASNRRLVEALLAMWDGVPDQRFGQLVMNLSRQPGGFADTWEWTHRDWFERLDEAAKTWAKP